MRHDLSPAIIIALVERSHGQIVLTREELYDAGRLLIDVQENGRGEYVLTTFKEEKIAEEGKPWWRE